LQAKGHLKKFSESLSQNFLKRMKLLKKMKGKEKG
jgi:hypothetical protein